MKMLLNCFSYYKQSDWPEKVITIFIMPFILERGSLTCDP